MSHPKPSSTLPPIAPRLLAWWDNHGRKDLPWQLEPTPYRVWVSEVMLQQTQVATVIDYFTRFMARFPDLGTLASASIDEVLSLWSGLGYYARARNLHKTATLVAQRHGGQLPQTMDDLVALPGIGRSTAGAILALSHNQRQPILDGNVKRVLTRYYLIETAINQSSTIKTLWALSDEQTPSTRAANYTQAIMDLGATVCTRRHPQCDNCPLGFDCGAAQAGRAADLPVSARTKTNRTEHWVFLMLETDDHCVLLERRPDYGIWGGLWCFPQFQSSEEALVWAENTLATALPEATPLKTLRHAFTHFRVEIQPLLIRLDSASLQASLEAQIAELDALRLVSLIDQQHADPSHGSKIARLADAGIPKPVRSLVADLVQRTQAMRKLI